MLVVGMSHACCWYVSCLSCLIIPRIKHMSLHTSHHPFQGSHTMHLTLGTCMHVSHTHKHPFACRPASIKEWTHIRVRHTQDRHIGHRRAAGDEHSFHQHRNGTERSPLPLRKKRRNSGCQPIECAAAAHDSTPSRHTTPCHAPQAQHCFTTSVATSSAPPQLSATDLMRVYQRAKSTPP